MRFVAPLAVMALRRAARDGVRPGSEPRVHASKLPFYMMMETTE